MNELFSEVSPLIIVLIPLTLENYLLTCHRLRNEQTFYAEIARVDAFEHSVKFYPFFQIHLAHTHIYMYIHASAKFESWPLKPILANLPKSSWLQILLQNAQIIFPKLMSV